jgi:aryl-alcohol dehydrogenase-like predicted oxidoreductase
MDIIPLIVATFHAIDDQLTGKRLRLVLPLIAAGTEEQFRENLQAPEISLSENEMKLLNKSAG